MKVEHQDTPAVMRQKADAWFARQCEVLAKAYGDQWSAHREWIEDYLREELRQRLVARGWRLKK